MENDRFEVTITDINGRVSLIITDYQKRTRATITEDDFDDLDKKALSLAWMCRFIVEKLKKGYKDIQDGKS